jgi:ABC-type Co2+ transport system permease subunit
VSALGAAVRHGAAHTDQALFAGVLAIVAIGVLKVLLRKRLSPRHSVSLDLAMVAIGFFLILMMRLPLSGSSGWLGLALFLGLGGVYKLLGYFEEP